MMTRHSRRQNPAVASVHDLSRARLIQGLKNLHVPYDVYTECGHQHSEQDSTALYIEPLGWVCTDGLVETICTHCCVGETAQAQVCVDKHEHKPDRALCPTMALIEGLEPPWA
jgi:hypothetical protein